MKNGPLHLAGSSMVYFNGSLIVLGGISEEDELNEDVLIYDLDADNWTSKNFGSWKPRSLFGAAEIDGLIYILFGWDDVEFEYVTSILSLDLSQEEFKTVPSTISSKLITQNYGYASDGESIYLFGGYSNTGITNALLNYSPKTSSLSTLSKKYSSPKNLMNASLVRISTFLYLFGGMYKETRYNDLWKFDLELGTWSKTKSYGDIPAPRSHHSAGADGDIMVVFGGKDATQYFNDAYQFNSITLTWNMLKYVGLNPSARFSACMVLRLPVIYIYGGETLSGFSLTLYKYNISDTTYQKISDSDGFVPGNGQVCFINDKGDELRVLYGTSDGDEPLGYVQSFNFTSLKWKTLYMPNKSKYNRARPIIADVKGNYYITGGSTWATSPRKEILKLDMISKTMTKLGMLDRVAYQAPSVRYKNKIYIYGGGSAYKELIRYDIAVRSFFSIDLFELCSDDCEYVCAEGSYYNSTLQSCESCPPGQYSAAKGSDKCEECFAGTYNEKYGASSHRQCYPCNEGQYSPTNGSNICYDCQAGYYCPIGSASPSIKYSESLISYKQPKPYQRRTDEANFLAMQIQVIVGVIGFLILLSLLPIRKIRPCLIELDQFDDGHNYEDEVPLVTRKTIFGGVFSFIYIILAIVVIISTVVLFFMDNVIENKSLIPFVVLKELTTTVKGNVQVDVILGNYGGYCVDIDEDNNESCSSSIFFGVSGLKRGQGNFYCKRSGLDCNLNLDLEEFVIEPETNIYISLQEEFSYTSQITVTVTSESSIPDEVSQVKMIAYPKENHVFRGDTPTTFRFSFTPSYYSSEDDGREETGYHVSPLSDPSGGTAFEPTNLGFTADLQIKIVFERSTNGLYTERILIYTPFILILTLIGSIPGIKDIVGWAMEKTEEKYLNAEENKKKNDMLQDYKQKRINSADFFLDHPSILNSEESRIDQNSN